MSALEDALLYQLRASGLPTPERETRFAPPRRWRFDFAWPDLRVACEVEGGVFTGGRHTRGAGFTQDCEKYSEAAIGGWLVVRVTGEMVRSGKALDLIERALKREAA